MIYQHSMIKFSFFYYVRILSVALFNITLLSINVDQSHCIQSQWNINQVFRILWSWFGGHIWWCTGLFPLLTLHSRSTPVSVQGTILGFWSLNLSWLCARQVPYLLWYYSNTKYKSALNYHFAVTGCSMVQANGHRSIRKIPHRLAEKELEKRKILQGRGLMESKLVRRFSLLIVGKWNLKAAFCHYSRKLFKLSPFFQLLEAG